MEKKQSAGGYSPPRPLNAHDLEVFAKATEGLTGIKYTPEWVSTQVVAGINYRFFCTAKTMSDAPEIAKTVVTVFEELPANGGRIILTGIIPMC